MSNLNDEHQSEGEWGIGNEFQSILETEHVKEWPENESVGTVDNDDSLVWFEFEFFKIYK